jgi:hypothetical protein
MIRSLDFSLSHVIDIPCFHFFFLGLECFSIGDWREQYPVQLLRWVEFFCLTTARSLLNDGYTLEAVLISIGKNLMLKLH